MQIMNKFCLIEGNKISIRQKYCVFFFKKESYNVVRKVFMKLLILYIYVYSLRVKSPRLNLFIRKYLTLNLSSSSERLMSKCQQTHQYQLKTPFNTKTHSYLSPTYFFNKRTFIAHYNLNIYSSLPEYTS